MKKFTSICLAMFFAGTFGALHSHAQLSFTNANAKLTNVNIFSGCAVTVADMNGDGLDDIARLNQGHDLYIEYQKPGHQFQNLHIADFGGGSQWGMCVADVDHNGYNDVLAGGNNSQYIQLMKLDAYGLMGNIITLSTASISGYFMQNANFMDVNNDGWEDIFTCNDNGPSVIWVNDGTGNFTMSSIINFAIHPWTISTGGHGNDPADAGNYGSVWTDFDNDGDVDLYVAHCRQGVSSTADPRRIDQLWVNDGNNNYTQMDTVYGVADSMETWTASFADFDNDGDFDLMLFEQDSPSRVLENDGAGHYTEITSTTGINLTEQPIESVMEDFDNDGFVDVLIAGSNSELFHNNGNKTFTKVINAFDNNAMESFAVGDLNHDGKIDIYASYANIYTNPTNIPDVIWFNSLNNGNNFLTLHLIGTTSNMTSLGVRAEIYGAWGKQIREVRSGESYGTCNTADLHFGLGTAATIDSVVLRWPSGTVTHIDNPSINQFITVKENTCISPDNNITSNGPLVLCTGQTVTLNAPAGYTYLWSDSSTTQSIVAGTAGEFAVTIFAAGNACSSTSATLNLQMNPDETPVISTIATDLNICQGSTITLTSTPSSSYLWSNGATTQSIDVDQTGSYSVTTQGACQSWNSNAIAITVYPAPAPTANDVTIPVPGSATLNATGTLIAWYNVATGGIPLTTGPSFITPFLTSDTVFYAENQTSYGGGFANTGQLYHTGSSQYSGGTTNAVEIFDVIRPCVLKTVKVYTDTPGDRIIELRDFNDNVLQSLTVTIPMDTSVVALNFNLTPGISYRLGTNEAQNVTVLGTSSPRLQRSNSGVNYPYTIANYISIKNSDQGTDYYYYFYDWQIEESPTICSSARVPVHVYISTLGVNSPGNDDAIRVYPNPSDKFLNVHFGVSSGNNATIKVLDLSGRVVSFNSFEKIANGQIVQLDISKIAAGSYMMIIENEKSSYSQNITIME